MMLRRLRQQGGWVVMTAVMVMALILMTGLATLAIVDSQSQESQNERKRESAFNLAEGLLNAQSVVLQNNWPTEAPCTPTNSGCGYATTCTPATTGTTLSFQCPDPTELRGVAKIFNNVDITRNTVNWQVTVRDDVGAATGGPPPIYNTATVRDGTSCTAAGQPVVCSWDANNNKRLWVRADATVTDAEGIDRRRSLVALLQLESYSLPITGAAITGGSVNFANSGAKTGVAAGTSQIVVRCSSPAPNTTTGPLTVGQNSITVASASGVGRGVYLAIDTLGAYEVVRVANTYTAGSTTVPLTTSITKAHGAGTMVRLAPGQRNGDNVDNDCTRWDATKTSPPPLDPPGNYTLNPSQPNALTAAQAQLILQGADAVYNNSCPPNSSDRAPNGWSGKIVIERLPPGGCEIDSTGANSFNTPPDEWGWIVVLDPGPTGSLDLPNNSTYYGVIIMGNPDNRSDVLMEVQGNATVWGGISVDGAGRVDIGSTGGNCPPGLNSPCPSVIYDPDAWLNFTTSGAAGLVQNTWRELPVSQQN